MAEVEKKVGKWGKLYCVACKAFEGKLDSNGKPVHLYCFPSGQSAEQKERKRAWIAKVRTVRTDSFQVTKNTRLCSQHFIHINPKARKSIPDYMVLTRQPPVVPPERRSLVRHAVSDVKRTEEQPLGQLPHEEETPTSTLPSESAVALSTPCEVEIAVDAAGHGIADQSDHTEAPKMITTNVAECGTQTVPEICEVETAEIGIQVQLPTLTFEDVKSSDEKVRFYTGFPNIACFLLMFSLFVKHGAAKLRYWDGQKRSLRPDFVPEPTHLKPGKQRKLRPEDEFFLTCLRLRLGLLEEHLADMFVVSVSTVSRILNTWINFMATHCKGMIPWPTREQILVNLPSSFSNLQLVRLVIDCTEFFVEKPSSLQAQWQLWSEYKHHNTAKICIGCAPNGLIMFVSRLWGGRASDRHIVEKDGEGFIPLLQEDDIVMADKGFQISDLLPVYVGLNMPPFIAKDKQMTAEEFFKTKEIAGPRIVIEMANEQLKNFRILQGTFPLNEFHLLEQIIVLCCAWTNLYEPILK